MKGVNFFLSRVVFPLLLAVIVLPANAQFVRSSYFMEGVPARMNLNPALYPTNSYINVPVLGSFNATAISNSLGTSDIQDLTKNSSHFYSTDNFRSNLKDLNRVSASINTDIISFGWHKGKGFWSVNVGERTDINVNIDRSLFDYLYNVNKDGFKWNGTQEFKNAEARMNVYTEIGVGYARQINSKLTVGAKLKYLIGMGNVNLKINDVKLEGNEALRTASITTDVALESSLKGLELQYGQQQAPGEIQSHSYMNKIKMNSYGAGGYGAAIDLGATYKVIDKLTVSASVIDLGFISWSKNATTVCNTYTKTRNYNVTNYQDFLDIANKGDVLNYELLDLSPTGETKSRKTSLAATIALGAEYEVSNTFAVGALFTNRNAQPNNLSEVTLSANYRPKGWFNVTGSYSMIQSAGKSFGLGLKLGMLYLGTDYMFFGNNTKCVNAQIGMSIPIGKSKSKS